MNVFKIAWRSIQHRGFGSLLTIISMALGVMMVVAVLSIHGLVSQSFKSNNSFGYNIIVGARGGGLQLTLNTVYYLGQPVENIPYEYYLAFCDAPTRERELKNSVAYVTKQHVVNTNELASLVAPGGLGLGATLCESIVGDTLDQQQAAAMRMEKPGLYNRYTHIAVPICLGDSYVDPETLADFRCVGTKPNFFTDLVLDIDTEENFRFAQGRCFVENSPEHGFFECVVGAVVARQCGIKLGDRLQATHGDPDSSSAHIHEQEYTVVGIIEATGTPHDRVVFLNMEGFFLMEDHAKPVEDDSILKIPDDEDEAPADFVGADPFSDGQWDDDESAAAQDPDNETNDQSRDDSPAPQATETKKSDPAPLTVEQEAVRSANATRIPLPIEQREVTSILVRTSKEDPAEILSFILPEKINEGDLESTLDWTPFRPVRSQKASQAVNPIMQIASLFELFVDPIRWLLLALTSMICVVSALSILVGIYNSMNQRQHEIAVMRALGASRRKVMMIMLCEAMLLAFVGGLLGWIAGHGLNAALGPFVEARTGVPIGFFNFAPAVPLAYFTGGILPESLASLSISPEFLLIPSLMALAVVVGIYPAISAYRTDVSKALGK